MNCLHSRKLLLALPRQQSDEHRTHIEACHSCRKLRQELDAFERDIEDAALIPIPDALTHRILLRKKRMQPVWRYAAAAVLAVAATGMVIFAGLDEVRPDRTAQAVGPTHPAVAAIAEVADERLDFVRNTLGDEDIRQGLKRLGLALKGGDVSAYHLGKCQISAGRDCDHIVISTHDAHADVMLLNGYAQHDRLLVEDRHMVALVGPAAGGVYIVVAQSPRAARRVEKLFVKS